MRGVKIYFFAFKNAIFGKIWHKFEILSWRSLMLKISTFRILPLIQTYIFIILCLSYFKLGHWVIGQIWPEKLLAHEMSHSNAIPQNIDLYVSFQNGVFWSPRKLFKKIRNNINSSEIWTKVPKTWKNGTTFLRKYPLSK